MKRTTIYCAILLSLLCSSISGPSVQVRGDSLGSYSGASALLMAASPVPAGTMVATAVPELAAFVAASPEGDAEKGKTGNRELIYKTINFILLVGGLAFLLRKPLGAFFLSRSAEIREGLEEGRKALAESQARMSAIEEKLRHLEEEIASFKASAAREMQAERERMRVATAAEAEKMLESGRSRMETTTRAAKLGLRFYIAGEVLKQAEQMIRGRLDDATRSQLVNQFVARLDVANNKN